MIATQTRPPRSDVPPGTQPFSLARLAFVWFLGLTGLYALYTWGACFGLEAGFSFLERVVMALGPTMVAFALLISPSVFAAGVRRFDLPDGNARESRNRHMTHLGLFAVVAFSLSALGSSIAAPLVPAVQDQPVEALTAAPRSVLQLASLLIPLAIAILTIISGFAGALLGLTTRGWRPRTRIVAAWFACLALIASFLIPFLVAVNLIVHHSAPAAWIIVGPLVLPMMLTGTLAWRERHSIGMRIRARRDQTAADAVDAESLDRIISEVTRDSESGVDAVARTESELEMAHLAASIRRIAAPHAKISEPRVQEIVANMLAESPRPETRRPDRAWPRIGSDSAGVFCASWACLAAGLLIVSPLGGVPPSVISAVAVGFVGSSGVVLIGRRRPAMGGTVLS